MIRVDPIPCSRKRRLYGHERFEGVVVCDECSKTVSTVPCPYPAGARRLALHVAERCGFETTGDAHRCSECASEGRLPCA